MTGFQIFWPILAHVLLVYGLYGLLRIRRGRLFRERRINADNVRWSMGEPPESQGVLNAIGNQFELPVLFYVCCILLYIAEADNLAAVLLAWLFVATRYAHAAVHVTTNRIRFRFYMFISGYLVLGAMWIWLAVWMATS
ncbi:MAPEG family protein [Rhizobium halophytocola]|uniref:MAPEG family protein n=1 Tax=Rhizobium halophytocola TaxID=735519 RepID=A0ABS4DXU9_9HYPH|nr:MAPEG family protein [Rhizobium halophytocola]MBP1850512.1 hypothetical protein [Rhizobium halophytocola]